MPNGTATLTLEQLQYLKRCFMGINADGEPLGYDGTMEAVDKVFDILDHAIAEAKRELTDAVRGLSHAQLGVIRAVISVPHPNETPQLACAREQEIGWLTAVIEALHD